MNEESEPMKRRTFLSAGAAILATPAVSRIATDDISLRDLAPPGLEISSTYNPGNSRESRRLLAKHCSVLVPEYELKPSFAYGSATKNCLLPNSKSKQPNWPLADSAIEFSTNAGLKLHAHTLYWPKHDWPACFMGSRQDQHSFIRAFARKIAGAKTCDVLNEILWKERANDNGSPLYALHDANEDFSQLSIWSQSLAIPQKGVSASQRIKFLLFVVRTLRDELALMNSSETKLLINEDQLTWAGEGPKIKRKALLGLLKHFESQGAHLDGVGLQGHILADVPVDAVGTREFVRDLGRQNCEVHFSEMDYGNVRKCDCSTATSDANHMERFQALLSACLPEPNVRRLGFWGLLDMEHHLRKMNDQERPALFHMPLTAKPVFHSIAEVLAAQVAR